MQTEPNRTKPSETAVETDDDKSDRTLTRSPPEVGLEELLVLGGAPEPSTLLQRLAMQMVYRSRPTNIPEWSAMRKTRTFQLGFHGLEQSTKTLCSAYKIPRPASLPSSSSSRTAVDSDDDDDGWLELAPADLDLPGRAQRVFIERKMKTPQYDLQSEWPPSFLDDRRQTDLQSEWSMAAAVQLLASDPESSAFRFAPFWIADFDDRSMVFPAYVFDFSNNGVDRSLSFVVDDPRHDRHDRRCRFVDNLKLNGPVASAYCAYVFDDELLNDTVVSTAPMSIVISNIFTAVDTAGFAVVLAEIVGLYLQFPAIPQILKDAVPKPRY